MRKVSVLRGVAILGAVLLVPAVASAKDPVVKADKVTVCHVTGTGAYHPITISKNAEPAHLAHGDARPGSLVGDKFVADDCSLKNTSRVDSSELSLNPLAWGRASCSAGTRVVGGGYEPAEATLLISEAAEPESSSGLYPIYPNFTFADGETGWVIQNNNEARSIKVYAICVAL